MVAGRRCMSAAAQGPPATASRSKPLRPITTRRPSLASPVLPGPVEMMGDAPADALHDEAHGLAVDRREALDPQHAVAPRRRARPGPQRLRRTPRCRRGIGNALEIVVVVVLGGLVMRGARGEIGFGGGVEAEDHGGLDAAVGGLDDLDRPRQMRARSRPARARRSAVLIRSVLLSRIRSAQRSWSSNTSSSGLS